MLADGVTAEGFDSVMHLHIRAALFGMKYAIPVMRSQGGGSIISTASVAGLQAGYGPVLYSIAKAAIVHMTHVTAAQLGAANIRVNCICPGLIATNIAQERLGDPEPARRDASRRHRGCREELAAHPARRIARTTSRKLHSIWPATAPASSPAMRTRSMAHLPPGRAPWRRCPPSCRSFRRLGSMRRLSHNWPRAAADVWPERAAPGERISAEAETFLGRRGPWAGSISVASFWAGSLQASSINAFEFVLNGVVLADQWPVLMKSISRPVLGSF